MRGTFRRFKYGTELRLQVLKEPWLVRSEGPLAGKSSVLFTLLSCERVCEGKNLAVNVIVEKSGASSGTCLRCNLIWAGGYSV